MSQIKISSYPLQFEEKILSLYKSVGWANYTKHPDVLKNAFENSLSIFAAYDNEELVGIIRVVGDGYSIIYIQDLLVHPNYQRQKIGTQLLQAVLDKYKTVFQIVLLTDNTPKTISFYQSFGLHSSDKFGCISFVKMQS